MVIHRRDQLRSEKILQDRVFNAPKITIVWNKVVQEILGRRETPPAVTGVRLRDTLTAETQEYPLDGRLYRDRTRSRHRPVSRSAGHGCGTGTFSPNPTQPSPAVKESLRPEMSKTRRIAKR